MGKTHKRPTIPPKIQCELWARAAGRCQFRGCNKLLYKDEVTQQRTNLGVISHIVACSPDGPRGHPTRSVALAKDISNLMLTCRDHGKLIDDQSQVATYPEHVLLDYKHTHEQRVRIATAQGEDMQTHVLLLQIAIDKGDVIIDPAAAHRAIQPHFPVREHPTVIDLSGSRSPAEGEAFFTLMAQSITQQIQDILTRRAGTIPIASLSIFALGPIPLLIHAGWCLGDTHHVALYQRHRDTQDWTWKEDEEVQLFYEVVCPPDPSPPGVPLVLMFSVSGNMSYERVSQAVGADPWVYEIRARAPGRDFLRSRTRLDLFGYEVRKALVALQHAHYARKVIHVFAALPAPMAITFGRHIKSLDTPFIIYEYENTSHAYVPALRINDG